KAKDVALSDKVLEQVIEQYTRESGVRELDRVLASIMRKVAKKIASEEEYESKLSFEEITEMLGEDRIEKNTLIDENPAGVSIGMAWTSVGGDTLVIESVATKGTGQILLTGSLGDVMKESASTAFTYLKAHCANYGIDPAVFAKVNVHLHFPEGAVPKDGPSAGITILTALTSLFTQRAVKPFLAMTGEASLRGKVLPVGGIKEKILAAKRAGIKEIILSERNRKNIEAIEPLYIKNLKVHYVKTMDEVLELALQPKQVKNKVDFASFLKEENKK
ncbi:MAG TPA: S16 family serine protease, partial [Chitinophagales bacterium]